MIFRNSIAYYYRFKLFLAACIDYLIINLFFYVYSSSNDFFIIGIRQYFYIFFWILISYVFDRYYLDKSRLDGSNFIFQIVSSIKSIIVFGFVFLIYNWLLGNYISRTFLLIFCLNVFLLSTLGQHFLNKLISKKISNRQFWVVLDTDNYKDFLDSNLFVIQNKINLIYIDKIHQNINLIKDSYGLIVKDFEILSKDELNVIMDLKMDGFQIYKLSKWLKIFLKSYPPQILDLRDFLETDISLINNSVEMRLKRFGDIFISSVILIICLPIIVFVGIFIYLEDKGPIFYSQKRSGYLGEIFTIWKLRSMKVDAEDDGITWSLKNDQRITKVGRFIRKTRLDELPQLLSVFLGDMSLIGPRPERPEFDEILSKKIPFYSMRYLLRPGLSGWAQVNYSYTSSIDQAKNKLSLDLYYISNYSIFLDLSIFFKTLRLIFNAKGS